VAFVETDMMIESFQIILKKGAHHLRFLVVQIIKSKKLSRLTFETIHFTSVSDVKGFILICFSGIYYETDCETRLFGSCLKELAFTL
jgi:hypothetical protein